MSGIRMKITGWCAALVAMIAASAPAAETAFDFSLPKECTTSAGVYRADGRLARTLWSLKKLPAGAHHETWDGRDDLGRNLPGGPYEVRIACSNTTYACVGTLGNSGVGTTLQSGTDDLIVDRANGDIYTANNWEEAGQDFRKTDAAGRHLMDAHFCVRNGNPNGWPIAAAVNDGILYCSVFTVHEKVAGHEKTLDGGEIIRKFDAATGKPLSFPTDTDGYIRVRAPDPNGQADVFEHQSLRSMAICGPAIVAADRDAGKVYTFDKQSGRPSGAFAMNRPVCVVVDEANRLWIAHDRNQIAVTDLGGKVLANSPAEGAGEIACIRLGPDHRLWLADQDAGQLRVYEIGVDDRLVPVKTWGHKAAPGDFGPLAIGRVQSFDVMPDGGFVLAQTYGHGTVVTRFTPQGQVAWQQVGLEFCTNATYDQQRPDLFISSLTNAYRETDRAKGQWQFDGCLYQGPIKVEQSTGTPRIIERAGHKYYYSLTGDQVKVFRVEGRALVASALVGLTPRGWDERAMGTLPEKDRPTHFAWHDANGDGQVQPDEVARTVDPKTQIATFSCEVDEQGNLIIPNHFDNAIDELPLARLDEHGNPVYEWSALRRRLAPDDTLRGLRPQKACPLPGGGMYVLQQADAAFYPPSRTGSPWGRVSGLCWMGGWVFSKYDAGGRRLFTVPLPEHSTGMDWVPNIGRTEDRGVVVGVYSAEQLYHYSPDGLLLGVLRPGHQTGWLDHNGSISINRNPSDGLVDLFAEDSLANRITWYRFDDRDATTIRVAVDKQAAADPKASDEPDFYAALNAARGEAHAGHWEQATNAYEKALNLASDRDRPLVESERARAFESQNKPDEAAACWQRVIDAAKACELPKDAPEFVADAVFHAAADQLKLKRTDEARRLLEMVRDFPDASDGTKQRAREELARLPNS